MQIKKGLTGRSSLGWLLCQVMSDSHQIDPSLPECPVCHVPAPLNKVISGALSSGESVEAQSL